MHSSNEMQEELCEDLIPLYFLEGFFFSLFWLIGLGVVFCCFFFLLPLKQFL